MDPLFLDISNLSARVTDDALELICKSSHDDDEGIWKPHESKLIRRLIEMFTQRGLDRLAEVKKQLIEWESGVYHNPDAIMPEHKPGMMRQWGKAELDLVKLYLQALPVSKWTLDDHMMAVDYVVQRYLPIDELLTESEWATTKASMMGKVQAHMTADATIAQANLILAALPSLASTATSQFNLSAQLKSQIGFARVKAAENVRALTDSVRHKMQNTILQHIESTQSQPAGVTSPSLESKLLDQFGVLNRDWRRIAVTELGEAQTQGYIASLKPGTRVKRVEQYQNACSFCKRIDGVIAEVVSPTAAVKNPETQIWPGKNNIGRSASPRKRVGSLLVPRSQDEMWHLPAGLVHPHCRGRWVPTIEMAENDDKEFSDWLLETLS